MSLARLLTLGRTLNGQLAMPTRYRMTRPGALPTFGTKNPFAPVKAAPTPVVAVGTDNTQIPGTTVEVQPVALATARSAAGPADDRSKETESPRSGVMAGVGQGMASGVRWLAKVNPFGERPRRGFVPNFTGRRTAGPARAAVQTELSLDNLRVLRNDLSDADIEIVTRHGASASPKRGTPDSLGVPPERERAASGAAGEQELVATGT